jgi:hypothetical protein
MSASNNTDDDIPVVHPEVHPDYGDDIRIALRLLQQTDEDDPVRLAAQLLRAGVANQALAVLLAQLIPLAFGRLLLETLGAHLVTQEYQVRDRRTGRTERRRFRDDPLYGQVMGVLAQEMTRPGANMAALARRSQEVAAVKRQMAQGASPASIVLGAPIVFT